jgi:hypothetical protein
MILPVCCGTIPQLHAAFPWGVNIISRGGASHVGERRLDFAMGTA